MLHTKNKVTVGTSGMYSLGLGHMCDREATEVNTHRSPEARTTYGVITLQPRALGQTRTRDPPASASHSKFYQRAPPQLALE